jgi:hypothetical protein
MKFLLYAAVVLGVVSAALFMARQTSPLAVLTPETSPQAVDEEASPPAPPQAAPAVQSTGASADNSAEVFYHEVLATVFWVGEGATGENDFISNYASAWDSHWAEIFGGIDDPDERCGYRPCDFTPGENPFYIALPYNDLGAGDRQKSSATRIPWHESQPRSSSLLKNRWIELRRGAQVCYGQWEDVGPFEEDDVDYVFGTAPPANAFGVGAGIDLSPALRDCLRMQGNELVRWRFVEATEVPHGPWTEIITTSGVSR